LIGVDRFMLEAEGHVQRADVAFRSHGGRLGTPAAAEDGDRGGAQGGDAGGAEHLAAAQIDPPFRADDRGGGGFQLRHVSTPVLSWFGAPIASPYPSYGRSRGMDV